MISNDHNVRISTVSYLVRKSKKEPEYFNKIQSRKLEYEERQDLITESVKTKHHDGENIFSCQQIVQDIWNKHNKKIPLH